MEFVQNCWYLWHCLLGDLRCCDVRAGVLACEVYKGVKV